MTFQRHIATINLLHATEISSSLVTCEILCVIFFVGAIVIPIGGERSISPPPSTCETDEFILNILMNMIKTI